MKKYQWVMEVPLKVMDEKTGKTMETKMFFISWHSIPSPLTKTFK